MQDSSRTSWMVALATALAGCGSSTETPGYRALATSGAGGSEAIATTAGPGHTAVTSTSTGSGTAEGKGPPYPIVLAHGFFGFDKFAGADFADYFYGVKTELAKHGETAVFTPAVDPFNSSAFRGAQLADRVAQIRAETGATKVILIGHSQGGLDARVVAHDHPQWVAAVVTLQTPHHGTPVADVALKLTSDPTFGSIVDAIVKTAGKPLWDQIGDATSLEKPLQDFSTPGIAAFNAAYPDAPGVYYASLAGRSALHKAGGDCAAAAPPFVAAWDGTVDPIHALLSGTELVLAGGAANYPNDGLVRDKDAAWGELLGCVPADHLDMIGQIFGEGPGPGNSWSHRQLYVDLVAFLRQKGF